MPACANGPGQSARFARDSPRPFAWASAGHVRDGNTIVVDCDQVRVKRVCVLWEARDGFFCPRKPNTNRRSLLRQEAESHIQVIFG